MAWKPPCPCGSRCFFLVLFLGLLLVQPVNGAGSEAVAPPTTSLVPAEGRVLRRIAAGLGVPRWDWNLTADPCDSKRNEMNCVRYDCSFPNGTACHVTEIYLKGQNFSGELPSEFADFPNLLQIHLSKNLIHGGVPAQWARMKLQGLVLLGNRLSGLRTVSHGSHEYHNPN